MGESYSSVGGREILRIVQSPLEVRRGESQYSPLVKR